MLRREASHLAASALFTIAIMAWLALAGANEPPAISLKVSPPHFAIAPAYVTVQVRLRPEESDREVVVTADGPDFYRRSAWTIDGAKAPRLYNPIVYLDVPAGIYQIVATVGTVQYIRAWARAELTVLD